MVTRDERLSKLRGLTVGQMRLLQSARIPTAEGVEKLPEGTLRRALRRLDYSDMPGEREWFRRLQQRTDGKAETHPLVGALRDLDSMRLRQNGADQVGGIPIGQRVQLETLQMQPPP